METPFDPDRANPRFQALQARHAFREVQVLLSTPAGLLRRRYAGRTDSGERHPGRVDRLRMGDFDPVALARRNRPLGLVGPVLRVDTSSLAALDVDGPVRQLRSFSEG